MALATIKLTYHHEEKQTEIICDGKTMETACLDGLLLSEWVYPFMLKGVRWKGIYEEIRNFVGGQEEFVIVFHGTDADRKLLEAALADTPAHVAVPNSKVIILYRTEPLMTRITINGKAFDTARLENRTIDQWVQPFEIGEHVWKGIFAELEEKLGTNEYSIQFSGNPKDMLELINICPETVEITFKTQNAKSVSGSGGELASVVESVGEKINELKNNERLTAMMQSENIQNVKATAMEAGRKLDENVTNAAANIRNSEQYQKVMANENVQQVMKSNAFQKLAGFWNRLSKPLKYGIPIGVVLLTAGILTIRQLTSKKVIILEPQGGFAMMSKDTTPCPGGSVVAGNFQMLATIYFRADNRYPDALYLLESESGESQQCTAEFSDINNFNNKDMDYDADVNGTDINEDGYVDFTLSQYNGEEFVPISYFRVKMPKQEET